MDNNLKLGDTQRRLHVGDICKIDMSIVGLSNNDDERYKFLGFKPCRQSGDVNDGCEYCLGKMEFQNLKTGRSNVSCYGYAAGTPVVILAHLLPDDLFEI